MKLVIQRVTSAKMEVNKKTVASIGRGLVCFVGFTEGDQLNSFDKAVNKLCGLRVFEDEQEKMNLNVSQVNGELLIVPNFTLYANCAHGFRPSFIEALKPEIAEQCFLKFVEQTKKAYEKTQSGIFGADMGISQLNDGPITIVLEY